MHALGIDLGTTNSCAAVVDQGNPQLLVLEADRYTIPSVVAFVEDDTCLLGETAKRQAIKNPANTISAAKRLIGRSFDDPHTQRVLASMPYTCVAGPHGEVQVTARGHNYAIEQVSALILAEIKRIASEHFNEEITKAVITVPAYFNDRQRQATRDAGEIAGLDVLAVINEPTAAALAHGIHQGVKRRVGVFDFGGGTFDASILEVGGGVVEVLATDGDALLGGHDFDSRIFEWLIKQIEQQFGISLAEDLNARQRLREAAEGAKIHLSDEESVHIALPFLSTLADGQCLHFDTVLTRSQLEELVSDLVDRSINIFWQTMQKAQLGGELDQVLLVGGMTRMPVVRRRVHELTQCDPTGGVHPDLVVAVGAAVQADLLTQQTSAGILIDVTPHNLGILTVDGMAETIIPKDTAVPTEAKRQFSTVRDGQESVEIIAFQGNSRNIEQNQILGKFKLEGIRPAPRGQVEIQVRFAISADGLVNITASDIESGQAGELRVENAFRLTSDELQTMAGENRHLAVAKA